MDDAEIDRFEYCVFESNKEFVGEGGEAKVYKAHSEQLKRIIALKKFHRSFKEDSQKEVQFLMKLRNAENVVKIHGFLINNSRRCIGYVMEYMEYGSLHDAIHNKGRFLQNKLSYGPDRVLIWMHYVACGIQRLHEAGIIHRDLNPKNILLGKSLDDVKISDFGLARDIIASTLESHWCGTRHYMAPEILTDLRFKKAGDVFAFAITCWEMIERRARYEKSEKATSYEMLINERPEFKFRYISMPDVIVQLIKGWDRNPETRPYIDNFLEETWNLVSLEPSLGEHEYINTSARYSNLFRIVAFSHFEEELQRFKKHVEDCNAYYLQNIHYYEKASFFQDIADKVKKVNYYAEDKEEFSIFIFAPPDFSDRNKEFLKKAIRKRNKYFRLNNGLHRICVEGGHCFIVTANYGSHALKDIYQYVLQICIEPPTEIYLDPTKEERQLYPLPNRNIAVIGKMDYIFPRQSIRSTTVLPNRFGSIVFDKHRGRFTFFNFEKEDDFEQWKKQTSIPREFSLLCILCMAEDLGDQYQILESSFERFRKDFPNKENLALVELCYTDEMMQKRKKLMEAALPHVRWKYSYTPNRYTSDLLYDLALTSWRAPVVYLSP